MIRRDHGRAVLLARPSILSAAWQDALDGLRPDGWPSAEEVPLDLGEIVRAAESARDRAARLGRLARQFTPRTVGSHGPPLAALPGTRGAVRGTGLAVLPGY